MAMSCAAPVRLESLTYCDSNASDSSPEKQGNASALQTGGAYSGAVWPDLAEVIDAWPALSPALQSEIVALARAASPVGADNR
jgi:hypothetical protein